MAQHEDVFAMAEFLSETSDEMEAYGIHIVDCSESAIRARRLGIAVPMALQEMEDEEAMQVAEEFAQENEL